MAKHERVSNAGEFPQSRAQALHAPWRLSYLEMLGEAERAAAKGTPQQIVERPDMAPASAPSSKASCFLREYWLNPGGDEKNHVIVRTGMPGVVSKDAGA
ncbi:MAG TPA: hypothetical protein VG797_07270, partial [Phycisphaerales bacterium]|nr:hypothetical protein [Phycisphaerales bacterium]